MSIYLLALFVRDGGSISPTGWPYFSVRVALKLRDSGFFRPIFRLIGQNDEFREVYEYYRTRESNPLKKMQALMAVACKLLRVLYVMATKGVKYDPKKLLGDIHRPQNKVA